MQRQKARATDDEMCVLISIKRELARQAMGEIAEGLSHHPYKGPTITLLLQYLTNMVQTLELMLKLLSNNWNNHEVGKMYEAVFGNPHPDQVLVDCLKQAVIDQKYLFFPAKHPKDPKTIAHYIPEMEKLFKELRQKLVDRHRKSFVLKEFELPPSFGEFLRDNVAMFLKPRKYSSAGSVAAPESLKSICERHEKDIERARQKISEFIKCSPSIPFAEGRGVLMDLLT